MMDAITVFDGALRAAIRLFLAGAGLVAIPVFKPGGVVRAYRLRSRRP